MSSRLIKRDGLVHSRLGAIFPRGEFGRNVLTVLSGATATQAISILISPILRSLCSPADFGVYAFFLSITTFLANIAVGQYEMAIIVPEKDEDGINLVALALPRRLDRNRGMRIGYCPFQYRAYSVAWQP